MRHRGPHPLAAAAGVVVLLLLWTLAPAPGGIVPPLAAVLARGWSMAETGGLARDLLASLQRVAAGAAIGMAAATVVGALCVLAPLRALLLGPLELARPIPPIAWIPLTIAFFGVGEPSAVALVALAAFFPMLVALVFALDAIDPDLLLAARSLGASPLQRARHVYLPAMTPALVAGARLGLGIGWFSVVAAEMVGSFGGLGYGIQASSLNLEMERFFVYFLLIGLCGFAMNHAMLRLDHRLGRWRRAGT